MTVALLLATVVLLLVVTAATVLTRPLWAGRTHLAPAYGLLGLGVAAAVVLPAWLRGTTTGTAAGAAVLVVSAVVVVDQLRRAVRDGYAASLARSSFPVIALCAGLLLFTAGLVLVWGGPADLFVLTRDRFSHPLTIDNELPSLMAGHLLAGQDPRVPVATWLTSDRPPLQTGLLLLVSGSTSWAGSAITATQLAATSIVVQVAWVPAAWALGRAVGFSPRSVVMAVAVTGLSGTVLVNTVFTWPKLLSAAFVLAAVAVLVDLARMSARASATGQPSSAGAGAGRHQVAVLASVAALCTFGMLSHGAAVFAFPVVGVALWWARRGVTRRGLLVGAAVAVVLYLPWVAYQKFYDPPGDRLLKWHLAGVIDIDQNSVLHDIVAGYSSLTPGEVLSYKVQNFQTAFALPVWSQLFEGGAPAALRGWQFFALPGAVGLALLPLLGLCVAAAAQRWSRSRGGGPTATTTSGALVAATLAGVVLWCLVLFGPATAWVHAGSHVPILLAAVLGTAWLHERSPRTAGLFVVAQVAVTGLLYLRPEYPGTLHLTAVGLGVVGAVALLGAYAAAVRPEDAPGLHDHDAGHQQPEDAAVPSPDRESTEQFVMTTGSAPGGGAETTLLTRRRLPSLTAAGAPGAPTRTGPATPQAGSAGAHPSLTSPTREA